MPFLAAILAHTPFWVWIVLTALLALGLSRTRTGSRSFMSLILPALIFVVIALAKLTLNSFDLLMLAGTLAGGIVALALIALVQPARHTRRLADGLYLIRGEWLSLVIILAVFAANYAGAVMAATIPALAGSAALMLVTAAVNGFSAAFMAGRTLAHLYADAPTAAGLADLQEV